MFLLLFLFQGTVLISFGYFCTHAIAKLSYIGGKNSLSLGSTDPIVLPIVTHLNSAEACHRQSSARAAKQARPHACIHAVPSVCCWMSGGAARSLTSHVTKGRVHCGGAIISRGPRRSNKSTIARTKNSRVQASGKQQWRYSG